MLSATSVGQVQACYFLLGLPFVLSSRLSINLNSLHRDKLYLKVKTTRDQLELLEEDDNPYDYSPSTQIGLRNAYAALVLQQISKHAACHITFFVMVTMYTLKPTTAARNMSLAAEVEVPLLELSNSTASLNNAPKTFVINNVTYTKRRKDAAVNLCPHVPISEACETSCYSNLLLHTV
jgi:hypothetical protein